MNQSPRVHSGPLQDPHSTPLEELDVSDPRLFETDAWRPYFERLRREDPVHYLADSPFGAFWSVTKFNDIVHVDTHHQVFSSSPTIVIGDLTDDLKFDNFIFMDPPKHDVQRAAVQPVVAPANLAKLEPVIRERAGRILDALPVGDDTAIAVCRDGRCIHDHVSLRRERAHQIDQISHDVVEAYRFR